MSSSVIARAGATVSGAAVVSGTVACAAGEAAALGRDTRAARGATGPVVFRDARAGVAVIGAAAGVSAISIVTGSASAPAGRFAVRVRGRRGAAGVAALSERVAEELGAIFLGFLELTSV